MSVFEIAKHPGVSGRGCLTSAVMSPRIPLPSGTRAMPTQMHWSAASEIIRNRPLVRLPIWRSGFFNGTRKISGRLAGSLLSTTVSALAITHRSSKWTSRDLISFRICLTPPMRWLSTKVRAPSRLHPRRPVRPRRDALGIRLPVNCFR